MQPFFSLVLVGLFLLVVLSIWLVNQFGLWGILAVAVGVVLLFALLVRNIGWILMRLFMAPFKMKGLVLRNAQVEVHSLHAADVPQRTEDDISELIEDQDLDDAEIERLHSDLRLSREAIEAQDSRRDWYYVDLTITPQLAAKPGGFQHWEPGELTLESPTADADEITTGDDLDGSQTAEIFERWIFDPETEDWVDDAGLKFHGPVRLRFHCGIPREMPQYVLRYYFELFGAIDFASPRHEPAL